jgi:mannan polymerase II complex MNN11 subunit
VQWHSTVLAKLALIPQRVINGYYRKTATAGTELFADGDFVINFNGCDADAARSCETELKPFWDLWKAGGRAGQKAKLQQGA